MTRNETIAKLARRSISDRMQVIEKLWETLPEDHDPIELTDEQIAVVERRAAALDADPSRAQTWEQILARVKMPR